MNMTLVTLTIGAVLGVLVGKKCDYVLMCIWGNLRFWKRDEFYRLYQGCMARDVPGVDSGWFEGIAARKLSFTRHVHIMEAHISPVYDYFRQQQHELIMYFAKILALYLAVPAICLFHHLWWLLVGCGAGIAAAIWYRITIDGWWSIGVSTVMQLVEAAYREAGIPLAADVATDAPTDSSEIATSHQSPEAVTLSHILNTPISVRWPWARLRLSKWQFFSICWLGIDVFICAMEVNGFWQNFVHQEHYTIFHAVMASIGQAVFLQLFFAPIYFLAKFITKRRRLRHTKQSIEPVEPESS